MKKLFKVIEREYETRAASYRTNGSEWCYQDTYKTESSAIEAMHHRVQQFLFINSDNKDDARPALVLKTERRCVYVIVNYGTEEVLLLDVYIEEFPVI